MMCISMEKLLPSLRLTIYYQNLLEGPNLPGSAFSARYFSPVLIALLSVGETIFSRLCSPSSRDFTSPCSHTWAAKRMERFCLFPKQQQPGTSGQCTGWINSLIQDNSRCLTPLWFWALLLPLIRSQTKHTAAEGLKVEPKCDRNCDLFPFKFSIQNIFRLSQCDSQKHNPAESCSHLWPGHIQEKPVPALTSSVVILWLSPGAFSSLLCSLLPVALVSCQGNNHWVANVRSLQKGVESL